MKNLPKRIKEINLLLKLVINKETKLDLLSEQKTAIEDLQVELNKILVGISNQQRDALKHQ